jgi:D-alanyl-lipoteichoic acid acyltransferase DltB (MBOAT superfamily)
MLGLLFIIIGTGGFLYFNAIAILNILHTVWMLLSICCATIYGLPRLYRHYEEQQRRIIKARLLTFALNVYGFFHGMKRAGRRTS